MTPKGDVPMVAATMPKKPTPKKDSTHTSLKVSVPVGEMIGKLARLRSVSMEKLFEMEDVADFFIHLFEAELAAETERLKKRST